MHCSMSKKSGVLGVLGVPETLRPAPCKALRHGTPAGKTSHARCTEHKRCSPCAQKEEHTAAALNRLIANTVKRLYPAEGYRLAWCRYIFRAFTRGRMAHQGAGG